MFQRLQLVKYVYVPIPDHISPKPDDPLVLDPGMYYPQNPSIKN